LSTKERISIGISLLRLFILFLNVFMIGARYKADKMGDNVEPWPTLILMSNGGEERLFQE